MALQLRGTANAAALLSMWWILDTAVAQTDVVACSPGVKSCSAVDSGTCAHYTGLYSDASKMDGLMALASIFGILMAFGIGANDAANSWATSVGSRSITVGKAVLLCGFFEWLGATTIGYGVSKTIQKGVAKIKDPHCWACGYCDSSITLAMGGSVGALMGASLFLMLASTTGAPVSTTHSIVGGVVGMTMAGAGVGCLNWAIEGGLGGIVLSWIISPALSGVLAAIGYYLSKKYIIKSENPKQRAQMAIPVMFGFNMTFVMMMVLLKAKALKKLLELGPKFAIAIPFGILSGVGFYYVQKKLAYTLPSNQGTSERLLKLKEGQGVEKLYEGVVATAKDGETQSLSKKGEKVATELKPIDPNNKDPKSPKRVEAGTEVDKETEDCALARTFTDVENAEQLDATYLFRWALVANACLESFAHGSNDTANATGPFSAAYQFYTGGSETCDSDAGTVWILCVAGVFVAIGVYTFGYRVIKTIGEKITLIDFHKGFYIELGSTLATMLATILGMPVSTTHCQVGGVLGVGIVTSMQGMGKVDWLTAGKVFLSWVLTLPVAGLVAAIAVLAIKGVILNTDACYA